LRRVGVFECAASRDRRRADNCAEKEVPGKPVFGAFHRLLPNLSGRWEICLYWTGSVAIPVSRPLAGAAAQTRREGEAEVPLLLPLDPTALSTFDRVVDVRDPREFDAGAHAGLPLDASSLLSYELQDRNLMRTRFEDPITTFADRLLGSMSIHLCAHRFATMAAIVGDGIDIYCFTAMLQGKASLIQSRVETTSAVGLATRLSAGTRLLTSGLDAHVNLWLNAVEVEHALERMLDGRLRAPLEFKPRVDWTNGLAASLKSQIDFLMHEMTRRDGVADNPIALASMTDLILSLVLRGVPHNYLERLGNRRPGAVPAYVRRAEDFMRANAGAPIRMDHVADAAGCSVSTLGAVFRHFRDTTPLAALHAIRLELVQVELSLGPASGSIAEVARRYGFTNPGRFIMAYRRRFGEAPSETARRGLW
jgi:AraC-like DNA-binding protein